MIVLPGILKRLFLCIVAAPLLTGADQKSPASDDKQPLALASSGEIESFRIPERDAEGNLLWFIEGEKAKIIEEGKIEIFNVHVETYRKGQIDQTLKSPQCMLIRETVDGKVKTHAESTNAVEITGKNIVIRADGFQWYPDQARLVIQKNVKVVFERKKGPLFKTS